MLREKFLVENDSKFAIGRPIFRRFKNKNIARGPMPGAADVGIEPHTFAQRIVQIFEAGGGFAKINEQLWKPQVLFQLGHGNWLDANRNKARFWQLLIPVPAPRRSA